MRVYDIIKKKRDGGELSDSELCAFIEGFVKGEIPDYQASALLMAIFFRGLSERETLSLTKAMAASGDSLNLSALGDRTADKHSTGGVGDKTTLIVAPLAAAMGLCVAKMSGRGLGHTGGTVDKLEAIPGFRTSLSSEDFLRQAREISLCIVGQSGNMTPADKKLYALRDVTATVDSIPLIAASIMSKKLAGGSKNIVLDVKYGSGAFMKSPQDALKLAEAMLRIGKSAGRRMTAVITNMNTPLGFKIGNSLEVQEAVEVLSGGGPEDLRSLSLTLAALMYSSAFSEPLESSLERARDLLEKGGALKKFIEMLKYQGGDVSAAERPELFERSRYSLEFRADREGFIFSLSVE